MNFLNNLDSTTAQPGDEQVFAVNNGSLMCVLCILSLLAAMCATIIAWLFPHGIEAFSRANSRSGLIELCLFGVVVVICAYYLLCLFKYIILAYHRLSLRIHISNIGIKISNKSRWVLIKSRRLLHIIYNGNDEILLIIDIDTRVLTLTLVKYAFRKPDFRRLVQRLKPLESYTDDVDEMKRLYKVYRVNAILRTNHLELKMNSLMLN